MANQTHSYVMWNLTQMDMTPEQRDAAVFEGLIYDPYEGDPEAEVPEGVLYYPTNDWISDPLDLLEAFWNR